MLKRLHRLIGSFVFTLAFSSLSLSAWPEGSYIRDQEPDFLTFEELKKLSENPNPGGRLSTKLERFWKTPIINNEAWYHGIRPQQWLQPKLGPILTIATWNIEKSINVEDAIKVFSSPADFGRIVNVAEVEQGSEEFKHILRQRQRLAQAEILVLQEMDIGHPRSDYLNAAAEMAKTLNMNYAYGAEQLEIDPLYLGTEKVHNQNGSVNEEISHLLEGDPKRYKGVFGSAVLSRYPIKHVEVFQLKNQPYDWYHGEKNKAALVEKTRRLGTKVLFKNEITREMKVGGRIYFRVDLDVPQLPGGTLPIINIHLEIKCKPSGREDQMREILDYIREIKNPVVMLGDFNSAPNDISPTTAVKIIKNTVKNPGTWFNTAVTFLTPYGPANMARNVSNMTWNVQDPLVKDIKILAPNPLKKIFKMIENFQFSDGSIFDFRGDDERAVGKGKKLGNSNQRDFKGFKTTFQVRRPLGPIIGKLRLDWIFVKSNYLKDTEGEKMYRFAPHFGETMEELNTNLVRMISDHHPSVVDLPFEEPRI